MAVDISLLTSKQKKVYNAIETFMKQRGIPPTVREIGEMVGEKTPGAVQGILNRLEQKGVIKREVGMARSIQIVVDNSLYANAIYVPEIKRVSQRNIDDLLSIYNIEKYQPMSPNFIGENSDCFMISCPDNSLLESGIKYEDMLIIAKNTEPKDGDIVLVLYENHVLLRRYTQSQQPNMIILKADSDIFNKQEFTRSEARIVGKLIGRYTRF